MKVNSIGNNAIQVQIDGEDFSVADIVHKELLFVKHVKFAGVAPPHPLIKTLTIQVHSDGADEGGLLKDALSNARKKLQEILEAGQEAFPDAIPPKIIRSQSSAGPAEESQKVVINEAAEVAREQAEKSQAAAPEVSDQES